MSHSGVKHLGGVVSLSEVWNCWGCEVLGKSSFIGEVFNLDFVCERVDGCRE